MAIRTHLSTSPEPIVLRPGGGASDGFMKPPGFWYEVDGDWQRWCRDEQWGVDTYRHIHAVELGDTNMLMIDTLERLDGFHARFGHCDPLGVRSELFDYIDWAAVATEWDGVEIAPYQWDRRLTLRWYYGWDCAAGVIWRPKGVTVTYLGPVDLGDRVAEVVEE